ncbi:MAG: hypothetical protein IT368_04700 [Candidatus Hydrogenedentes bacterium]|nr:hypothetical protein [Candidatus Hydrogenedentota bacterium]
MKRLLLVIVVLPILAALAAVAPRLHEHTHATPTYQPNEIEAAKESIALSLLGQLQLSVGDLMWLKSMEYLHVGVVQRMPTRAEEEIGFRRQDAQNVAAGMGHTEGVTMVLDSHRDWRGLFGEIERNVKPYSTAHVHDDPVEIIPWYELAVRLNPSLERLYTLGAFYLADFAHEPGEARELLEAGIQANPMSFEIHGALGRLYTEYADRLDELDHEHHHHHEDEDHDEHLEDEGQEAHEDHHDDHDAHKEHAIETAEEAQLEAVELLTEAVELATEHRRQLASRREVFDDFQNQVFGESYLYLSKALQALGRYDEAVARAEEGFDTVSQYNQRNLLRVQARVAAKARSGEAADESDLAAFQRVGSNATKSNAASVPLPGPAAAPEAPPPPISVIAGVAPPAEFPEAVDSDTDLAVLKQVRETPLQGSADYARHLGLQEAEVQAALERLEALRFIAPLGESSERRYELLPPGLYVAMGHYGFNFWDEMEKEAEQLRSQGIQVNLADLESKE